MRKRWPTIPIKAQRDIVRALVSRVVVAHDEIEFSFRFRDSSERTVQTQHFPGPTSSRRASKTDPDEPLYIRLPKPGQLCKLTGMTRSALNALILQTERNGYRR